MAYKMKGFSGFKGSSCGCVGKCKCASPAKDAPREVTHYVHNHPDPDPTGDKTATPAKHLIGKHPAKDGHVKSDHKERRKERINERKKKKALSKFPWNYVESTHEK